MFVLFDAPLCYLVQKTEILLPLTKQENKMISALTWA